MEERPGSVFSSKNEATFSVNAIDAKVFAASAKLNHRNKPNVGLMLSNDHSMLMVQAAEDIEAGIELFWNYHGFQMAKTDVRSENSALLIDLSEKQAINRECNVDFPEFLKQIGEDVNKGFNIFHYQWLSETQRRIHQYLN